MNDMTEVLLIDRVDVENSFPAGGVVEIWTINRTEKLNALNNEVMESIISACKAAENDDNVRVVIIRGAPPSVPDGDERPKPAAFVAGADIGEFTGKNSKQIRKVFSENVWEAIWNLSIPTIASIDGFALGGGSEIILSCDMRIATTRSNFGTPEINLGLIPGGGGTQRLTRLLGYGKAMEMVMTGDIIPANEAFRIGLVNRLCEPDDLQSMTMGLAMNLASKSPHTIKVAKRVVRASLERPMSEGINIEHDEFCALFDTEDKEIGVNAFLQRERPEWKGN
ncbi:MAG TPA: enoyl-CoA hydratase/isomerase family protein [Candidatus Thalassarchaeaceae archaeon]|nr:enoyl-CoA hydratase/isomerase family protein [Candidatus Thalassarchaeaceae archaeon]HJM87448.1 enoyl-CoA hydratase/isomerase family protein [Candidatus Thalassarchaeaceae archaeon]